MHRTKRERLAENLLFLSLLCLATGVVTIINGYLDSNGVVVWPLWIGLIIGIATAAFSVASSLLRKKYPAEIHITVWMLDKKHNFSKRITLEKKPRLSKFLPLSVRDAKHIFSVYQCKYDKKRKMLIVTLDTLYLGSFEEHERLFDAFVNDQMWEEDCRKQ